MRVVGRLGRRYGRLTARHAHIVVVEVKLIDGADVTQVARLVTFRVASPHDAVVHEVVPKQLITAVLERLRQLKQLAGPELVDRVHVGGVVLPLPVVSLACHMVKRIADIGG